MLTRSLVEIEYTLIVHPLTRVTSPRTLNNTKQSNMLAEVRHLNEWSSVTVTSLVRRYSNLGLRGQSNPSHVVTNNKQQSVGPKRFSDTTRKSMNACRYKW